MKWYDKISNRKLRFFLQRRFRGFDDSETWSLDYYILEFTLPRLKRLREIGTRAVPEDIRVQYPNTGQKVWESYLDKMIEDIERFVEDEDFYNLTSEGVELFLKYFRGLWW